MRGTVLILDFAGAGGNALLRTVKAVHGECDLLEVISGLRAGRLFANALDDGDEQRQTHEQDGQHDHQLQYGKCGSVIHLWRNARFGRARLPEPWSEKILPGSRLGRSLALPTVVYKNTVVGYA